MPEHSDDLTWLLTQWQSATASGGEYMTWRLLVGRYPGKSNLEWLWGLIADAVEQGYLAPVPGDDTRPEPDQRVNWDRWHLTDKGHQLLHQEPTAG